MSLPVISILIILGCLFISIVIDFIIWGTYGIIKFGVRPAFTIANNTKTAKIYDQNLMQDIYVLDI